MVVPAPIAPADTAVMRIDSDACLHYVNAAAMPLLPVFVQGRPLWLQEIEAVLAGSASLPKRIHPGPGLIDAAEWEIWLNAIDGGYELYFQPRSRVSADS